MLARIAASSKNGNSIGITQITSSGYAEWVDRDDPRRVQQIFDIAVSLPPDEQARYLDRVCDGNASLRRKMRLLLDAVTEGSSSRLHLQYDTTQPRAASFSGLKLKAGDFIKQYKILKILGKGGMGIVYKARDTALDRVVALKFLNSPTEALTRRFIDEARMTARCKHENIVVIHGVDVYQGYPYIVLEYLEGMPLSATLSDEPVVNDRLARDHAIEIMIYVTRALACAHDHGIIHRDLKPENIFITRQGTVKVLDFGIAKARGGVLSISSNVVEPGRDCTGLEYHSTRDGVRVGTIAYMSPEQWRAEDVDERTDLWAMGLILYRMLWGQHLLGRKEELSWERLREVEDPERPMPAIGTLSDEMRPVAKIITACLQKQKERRLSSADELLSLLEGEIGIHRIKRNLRSAAQEWIRLDRCQDALWINSRQLRSAALVPDKSKLIREFLTACHEVARRRRRRMWLFAFMAVLFIALLAAMARFTGYQRGQERVREELDARIQAYSDKARDCMRQVPDASQQYADARRQVHDALRDDADGWQPYWRKVLALDRRLWAAYRCASNAMAAGFLLDPAQADVRAQYSRSLAAQIDFAVMSGRDAELDDLLERLRVLEPEQAKNWSAPVTVKLESADDALVEIKEYVTSDDGILVTRFVQELTPPATISLFPGSYVAYVAGNTVRGEVRHPFVVEHGSKPITLDIRRPKGSDIPEGFVYVPKGFYYHGYGTNPEHEQFREWYGASPMHKRETDAYLIARHETTYEQWFEYLESCGDCEQTIDAQWGGLSLKVQRAENGKWQITWRPSVDGPEYTAQSDERLVYTARDRNREHDWLQLPVSGVSLHQVDGYLRWLRSRPDGVMGADLCDEWQWERAARGADRRDYPHGNTLVLDTMNLDMTYGHHPDRYGPDEVGSYPLGVSPYGAYDMAGNVWEMIKRTRGNKFYIRGGSFYQPGTNAHVYNVSEESPDSKWANLGFRVCAVLPADSL